MSDRYTTLIDQTEVVADISTRPRIVIAIDGLDKHGKDHIALTAPKPLLLLDFDMGSEGVKGVKHPLVVRSKPFCFRPTEVSFTEEDEEKRSKQIMEAAWPEYIRFRETYFKALRGPMMKTPDGRKLKAKTVVVDTGSEAWELMRFAEFGKVTRVMPHHYTQVNSQMRDLVRAALESDVNVIWLHQLKSEWKDNAEGKGRKTGVLDRSGFDRMANLVQSNFLVYRVPKGETVETGAKAVSWKWGEAGTIYQPTPRQDENDLGFRLFCGNSRLDPTMEGMELMNDMIDFRTIAQMMMPETNEGDWADDA